MNDAVPLAKHDDAEIPQCVGPLLLFRGCHGDRLELTALIVRPADEPPPLVVAEQREVAPETIYHRRGLVVLRYRFSLPAVSGGTYRVADQQYAVAGIDEDDLRIAYVSCNGQEHGDPQRTLTERNPMWQRLAQQHQRAPMHLLLQGGDQLYADEMLDTHPAVRAWDDGDDPGLVDAEVAREVAERLRDYLLGGYLRLFSQPDPAWLLARVPSLCMWDDHDICDGWGSLPEQRMDGPIGRAVFEAAREFFMLFQLGAPPDDPPELCPDRDGRTLTWAAELPGLLIVAPDLRSERRPRQVLGAAGWQTLQSILERAGQRRVLVLSSVPALGPRLSWVEATLHLIPGAQKYEDDLRDQWQSRAHRDEWRRFLQTILSVHQRGDSPVTLLSGEIHLATRCTMASRAGALHQLIASGIAHPPPPRWYGGALGALARLGENPLPEHPIRLHPLPGQRRIYTNQRNYLILHRRGGHWSATWELEHDGTTPALPL